MGIRRAQRVGDQIMREVSLMLHGDIKDPRIGMVTISHVMMSTDLGFARIFYTVYGDEDARSACHDGLQRATGFVRRQLGQRLKLRVVPEIAFTFNASLDHVDRINELLKSVQGAPGEGSEDEDDTGTGDESEIDWTGDDDEATSSVDT